MSLSLFLSFDSLSRVDGSARFGFGQYPQFLTSLSGPIEVRLASEQPSRSTVEVSVRPLSNVPGTESKAAAVILKEIMQRLIITEANPRTLIQFVVQALVPISSLDDSFIASMINSCTLALINAGSVPMRGVICAAFVGRVGNQCREEASAAAAQYIVQPTEKQASGIDAAGCFAFLFSGSSSSSDSYHSSCVWTNWRSIKSRQRLRPGSGTDETSLEAAREVARENARQIWDRIKLLIEERESPSTLGSSKTSAKASAKPKEAEKMKVYTDVEEENDAKMEII
ncbi:hypothetical protein D9757_003324 [Collybiopsis confluens]|uniref:Exoribonuclease phosphorolytic domain-containing protein n=1 Tax=Collybiopsis confluens TaxID=2823264 RepID=A0A8H5MFH9_9AGAR|nr:hypothetical protein D9757_003324 [Collybiopsis confluens]